MNVLFVVSVTNQEIKWNALRHCIVLLLYRWGRMLPTFSHKFLLFYLQQLASKNFQSHRMSRKPAFFYRGPIIMCYISNLRKFSFITINWCPIFQQGGTGGAVDQRPHLPQSVSKKSLVARNCSIFLNRFLRKIKAFISGQSSRKVACNPFFDTLLNS